MDQPIYGDKLCECGCGKPTRIATKTDPLKGWVKGQPLAFAAPGHNARITNHHWKNFDPTDYEVQDLGHETPCWVYLRRWRMKDEVDRWSEYRAIFIKGDRRGAHRRFFEHYIGPIPEGYVIHHLCERPQCVNPSHLLALTRGDHTRLHREKPLVSPTVPDDFRPVRDHFLR